MKPTLHLTMRPIVIVDFHESLTLDEAVEHFRELGEIVHGSGPMAIVVDLSNAPLFSATMRKVGSDEMRRLYQNVGARIVGAAHVVGSSAMQGMLTAVHWIAPPPFPSVVVRERGAAIRWANARLMATRSYVARGA